MGKKKLDDGKASIRGYADMLACSHEAVRKAIREGRIVHGYDGQLISVDVANAEWGSEFVEKRRARAVPESGSGERGAAGASLEGTVPGNSASVKSKWDGGEIPNDVPFQEALRIKEILKAKEAQLELEAAQGKWVNKRELAMQLAVAGKEVRLSIERLPNKVVDAVRGAKDRGRAIVVMEDEIRALLEGIGDVIVRVLGEQAALESGKESGER